MFGVGRLKCSRKTHVSVCFRHKRFTGRVSLCRWFFAAGAIPAQAQAAESAVIIMYHRFGEKSFSSTNITLEQLEEHIKILTSGAYTVLPLPDIIKKIKDGTPLPARTVGITIDDAYQSTFTEAWPRLKKAKLPFTVFVSTDHLDRKLKNMMSWDQIRTLVKNGVTIGHHTASHLHMADHSQEKNKHDIKTASKRFQEELGLCRRFCLPLWRGVSNGHRCCPSCRFSSRIRTTLRRI